MATTEQPNRPTRRRPGSRRRGGSRADRPVPLYKRGSSHFLPTVRERGAELLQKRAVALEVETPRARARVEEGDGSAHAVGLDWSRVPARRALHAFCDCRRFAAGKPCEHLWATLLALAQSDDHEQPPGRDRVSLRKDQAGQWQDLDLPPGSGVRVDPPPPVERSSRPAAARRPHAASWRSQLDSLRAEVERLSAVAATRARGRHSAEPGLRFLINTAASRGNRGLVLDLFTRRSGPGGRPGKIKRASVEPDGLVDLLLPASADRGSAIEVVTALATEAARPQRSRKAKGKSKKANGVRRFRLPPSLYQPVLSHLGAQSQLGWWDGRRPSGGGALVWDGGSPWRLVLRLEPGTGDAMGLRGRLERNGDSVPLSDALLVVPAAGDDSPLVVFPQTVARLEPGRHRDLHWIRLLTEAGEIVIPERDLDEALTELYELPDLPRLEVPPELRPDGEVPPPVPRLVLTRDAKSVQPNPPLLAELSFHYGDLEVSAADPRTTVVAGPGPTLVRRDMEREHQAVVELLEAGARPVPGSPEHELQLRPQEVPAVAEPLLRKGWHVEVTGSSLRSPHPPQLRIESGIDWFELGGELDFAGHEVELTKILAAVSKGERFVELPDGSQGLLPSALSEAYESLAELAHDSTDDGLRFLPSQAMLVDALLTEMPPAAVDQAFAELRDKLRSFDTIKPKKEPRGFEGTLRGYQREGLGWLGFLREFGLGGVLADDMGLGKTVQVLALVRANRTPSKTTGLPWLVVVPRSLLYNWIEEAARFTPKLSVVEYGGPGREALQTQLDEYDVVLTTYGTLRRDIGFLATVEFDTVILDEAQAIKNRESQAAKASRLLTARHRLALTGTPIENHLGELGSIFEFLNPGLLGRLPTLDILASGRNASGDELERVARGIRPFILRRTKAQVLPDLPPKTEQVLYCTLEDRQRELYDQLRTGYQASLLLQAEAEGMAGSTIQVLEALLRLRQVACHPGLVNDDWSEVDSAKLDTLFDLVDEILDEGHKVLVFSQFTKLLGFVRERVEKREIAYAYLDGQTRKRGEVVKRFQEDPSCNLFLISLKAGGVGLNLTAAGYVFLLDPWWNPAVEAQAIDRTHRIGQTQPVFAYRLIARDTVEDKILQLQKSKRKLADAILEDDGKGSPLKELTADDLRLLLS